MRRYLSKFLYDTVQWWEPGDHPFVEECGRYSLNEPCPHCDSFAVHGVVSTGEVGSAVMSLVCPGDWILSHESGRPVSVLRSEYFSMT